MKFRNNEILKAHMLTIFKKKHNTYAIKSNNYHFNEPNAVTRYMFWSFHNNVTEHLHLFHRLDIQGLLN